MSTYAECPKCYGPSIKGTCKDCGHDPEEALRAELSAVRGELDEARAAVRSQNDLAIERLHRAVAADERLAEALDLLREMEWSFRQTALRNGGTIYTASLCPACMGEKDPPDDKGSRRRRGDPLPPVGHRPNCRLAALLSAQPPASGTSYRDDGSGWRFETGTDE